MAATLQAFNTLNGEKVGTHALNPGSHIVEHGAELIYIRLAGGIHNGGSAFGKHGGHNDVGRSGNRGLVEQHVAAFERRSSNLIASTAVNHFGTQLLHTQKVSVESAASYLVSSRLGNQRFAEAR